MSKTTSIDAVARAVTRKARRDLDLSLERLRFETRDPAVCITCGADLQGNRCPWSRPGVEPMADGRIYCTWPRASAPGIIAPVPRHVR